VTGEERSDRLLAMVERMALALEAIASGGKLEKPAPKPPTEAAPPAIPNCPKCGDPMLLRTAKATGNQFWGCAKFPKCDGTANLDGSPSVKRHLHPGYVLQEQDGDGTTYGGEAF
jgi:hypothetical protein